MSSLASKASIAGLFKLPKELVWAKGVLEDVGVFDGEDLVGEMDLARSGSDQQALQGSEVSCHTGSSPMPLL